MESGQDFRSRTLWARFLKRGFDIVLSTVLLLTLSPLLAVVGGLVWLDRSGPVLFQQRRSGRFGAPFTILKFRTLRGDHRPDPNEIVSADHPAVTATGRVLRRYKLDELPQLWNVLRGDMSLIGPRPTLPDQVERYDEFRRNRLLVRPGITGLAQIHGNTSLPWDERILFDIAYVRRCSFLLDFEILIRTFGVIALGNRLRPQRFRESRFAQVLVPPAGFGGAE